MIGINQMVRQNVDQSLADVFFVLLMGGGFGGSGRFGGRLR